MNIFYLSNSTLVCAQSHCDKHVVKMILESAQLLCTAHRVLDNVNCLSITNIVNNTIEQIPLYKKTHENHPCAIWVRTYNGYVYTSRLLSALLFEYMHRYDKVHKIESSNLFLALFNNIPINISTIEQSPAICMPDVYKISEDPVTCYKEYYRRGKYHMATWTKRPVPDFMSI